ncbi:hypothetical protein [Streptomyces boninensis]|uniref:hypothetical protein n=1 Tax=Streptomyces boninensis TaxID=2039455 RepID=UPI003B21AD0D
MAHSFPEDLVVAQRDWFAVYEQLAGREDGAAQTTVLRRRLQRLSIRVSTHPYWTTLPGRAPAARMELRELARGREVA